MSDVVVARDLRQQGAEELRAILRDAQQELFGLRMQFRSEQLTNVAAVKRARRHVARLQTVIREKELEIR